MKDFDQRVALLPENKRQLLARRLKEEQKGTPSRERILPRSAEEDTIDLSFAQQRLWFLDRLLEGKGVYNVPLAYRMIGPLNMNALSVALNEIVRRHEVLRTTFTMVDDTPVQHILPELQLSLTRLCVEECAEEERDRLVQQLLNEEARRPFDLQRGPLLRASLLQLAPQDHIFLLNIHHIVTDEWSMNVFFRELQRIYDTSDRGEPFDLPPLPIQYADFALWQRRWLQGDLFEQQLAHWKKHLQAPLPTLDLPTDHVRRATQENQGDSAHVLMSLELQRGLQQLGKREGVTFFMTIFAAFQVLLARYSGQQDLLVGTVIANRAQAELEHLIGFFINTLVLRTNVADNPRFLEVLQQVRATTLDAYANPDLPFEKLVEVLQPQREAGKTPFFQVLMTVQTAVDDVLQLHNLSLQPVEVRTGTARFEMTWSVSETPAGLSVSVEYRSDLFEATTIQRMLKHFEQILQSIVRNPRQRVSELPLLDRAEREKILAGWNQTETDYTLHCVHQSFVEQVRRTPGAVAVLFEHQQLTYAQLDQQSNQLAHVLQQHGVGPDTLVGLCMERSLELVVGLFAILKAGGAYVPLDPSYPSERLAFMVADAQVALLLTQEHLCRSLPAHQATILCLDTDWHRIAQASPAPVESQVTLDNLMYMIYTSGSTGKPKGVMNTHRALSNRIQWMQQTYQLDASDRILQKTPYSFDVSVWEFFWPLLYGATLVVARPEGHKDSAYLVRTIKEQQVTTLHFVPSMLQIFLQEEHVETCTSIRRIICSGEALAYDLQERFCACLPAQLHNLYGPTEAAIDVSYWDCRASNVAGIVPIGFPIANIQLYILDAQLQPVPEGVSGELYIGGIGLARGYHNRPALTAERFIPDPFAAGSGARLYQTGDLARYRSNGAIEYLGRLDAQVKVRGFRIETGEIEAFLQKHPLVAQAVVVAREYAPGDTRLVAYILPTEEQSAWDAEHARELLHPYLLQHVPEYMVPAIFMPIAQIPLTPSGKVDRKQLPVPVHNAPGSRYVAPRNTREQKVADLWSAILQRERIGIYDNFFVLGGHSLLATQVIAGIKRAFTVTLPLKVLFERPTIAEIADEIETSLLAQISNEKLNALFKQMEAADHD